MISTIKYSCLFVLLPALLCSQTFTAEGNEWIQKGENLVGWKYPVYIEMQGDTIINGKIYSSAYFEDQEYIPVPEYIGAVREENDSVYVIPANADSSEEFLIYDWTVIIGDTLKSNAFSWIVVEDILTINLLNGEERKQFDCGRYRVQFNDTIRSPLTIIEGVGCTDYGFLLNPLFNLPPGNFQLFSSPEDIRCYLNNSELLWQNEEVVDCDSVIVATEENIVSNHTFSIIPNPVIDRLEVKLPQGMTGEVTNFLVLDMKGQIVKNITKSFLFGVLEVDVSGLPPGLYFLALSNNELQRYTSKFIKL